MSTAQVKYQGSTPGADANTYVLFATTLPAAPTDAMNALWPQRGPALLNVAKFALIIKHTQAGTINIFESQDRGANWRQIDTVAIVAPGATGSTSLEFLIESLWDFKVEWVNGGVAQASFDVNIALVSDRASPL